MALGDFNGGGVSRFSFIPPVIKTLVITNIAVFLFETFFLDFLKLSGVRLGSLFMQFFALQPIEGGAFYVWQLVTYQFLHGGFWHILSNLFALWMFGVELENVWGSRRFFVYYLLSGIGAGLIHLGVSSLMGSGAPTVGASGSIFGILLAYGLTFPDRPVMMFPFFIPMPAKILVLLYAFIELVSGVSGTDSGVAHFAHLGGAITGFLLLKFGDSLGIYRLADKITGLFGGRESAVQPRANIYSIYDAPPPVQTPSWFRTQADEPRKTGILHPTEEITQAQIDAILDKITTRGAGSLTEEEKRILIEASKRK